MKLKYLLSCLSVCALSLSANAQTTNNSNLPEKLAQLPKQVIFSTITTHTGNLGGVEGANSICQAAANSEDSIVPTGQYVALIADSKQTLASLFPQKSLLVNTMNKPIATSNQLLKGRIIDSLVRGVDGSHVTPMGNFTGEQVPQVHSPANNYCSDWTSDSWSDYTGALSLGQGYTPDMSCGDSLALYCISVQ